MTESPTRGSSGQDEPKHITTFEVDEHGFLRLAGYEDLRTRREILDELSCDSSARSPKSLLSACEEFEPLAWEVHGIYFDARCRLEEEIESLAGELRRAGDRADPGDEQTVVRESLLAAKRAELAAMPEEPEDGALPWLRAMDKARFMVLVVPRIDAWLDAAPDWGGDEGEHLPENATGQGIAFSFFRDCEWSEELGVEVVEGFHPGDNSCVAVLKQGIAEANAVAVASDVPVRFVAAGS